MSEHSYQDYSDIPSFDEGCHSEDMSADEYDADNSGSIECLAGFGFDKESLGGGGSGEVYAIDDNIVLKVWKVWVKPSEKAPPEDHKFYAELTLQQAKSIASEQTVFKTLIERPHCNIAEPIEICSEGIYMRHYRALSTHHEWTEAERLILYEEIATALQHLHSIGIVHSDVRLDNVVLDSDGSAVLIDFDVARSPGTVDKLVLGWDLTRHIPSVGLSSTISEASDRFGLATLIYGMEIGVAEPHTTIFANQHSEIQFPKLDFTCSRLETIVQKAWHGEYETTSQMYAEIHGLVKDKEEIRGHSFPKTAKVPIAELKSRVQQWKQARKEEWGENDFDKQPTLEEVRLLAESISL